MKVHDYSWALLSTPEHSEAPRSTHNYGIMVPWVLISVHCTVISRSCVLMSAQGAKVPYSWVFMATQGCSVVLMAPRTNAHECLRLVISTIYWSWVLLSPHKQPWAAMITTEQPWVAMNTHEHRTLAPWALIGPHEHNIMVQWALMRTYGIISP